MHSSESKKKKGHRYRYRHQHQHRKKNSGKAAGVKVSPCAPWVVTFVSPLDVMMIMMMVVAYGVFLVVGLVGV